MWVKNCVSFEQQRWQRASIKMTWLTAFRFEPSKRPGVAVAAASSIPEPNLPTSPLYSQRIIIRVKYLHALNFSLQPSVTQPASNAFRAEVETCAGVLQRPGTEQHHQASSWLKNLPTRLPLQVRQNHHWMHNELFAKYKWRKWKREFYRFSKTF